MRNAELPSESDFPFWIDGSKLAFIGVIGVQIRLLRFEFYSPAFPNFGSLSGRLGVQHPRIDLLNAGFSDSEFFLEFVFFISWLL